jgi:hypothetical protein
VTGSGAFKVAASLRNAGEKTPPQRRRFLTESEGRNGISATGFHQSELCQLFVSFGIFLVGDGHDSVIGHDVSF